VLQLVPLSVDTSRTREPWPVLTWACYVQTLVRCHAPSSSCWNSTRAPNRCTGTESLVIPRALPAPCHPHHKRAVGPIPTPTVRHRRHPMPAQTPPRHRHRFPRLQSVKHMTRPPIQRQRLTAPIQPPRLQVAVTLVMRPLARQQRPIHTRHPQPAGHPALASTRGIPVPPPTRSLPRLHRRHRLRLRQVRLHKPHQPRHRLFNQPQLCADLSFVFVSGASS
jgi:hypothetical protein